MIKVLIVEDQELIRESFHIVLSAQQGLEVVGMAKDGLEALELLHCRHTDVVLLDIRMPNMDGITACRKIKEAFPKIKVIVLTTFDDDEYIIDSIKYGANGYLLKGVGVNELVDAIKTVYNNGTLINPSVASKLVGFFAELVKSNISADLPEASLSMLSKRENEMVQQVARGYSNKEIAQELFLSEGTVRNTISNILTKLDLRDRTQLVLFYLKESKTK